MAKLLLFAACEKVVISNEDNSGSLISILQGLEFQIVPPASEVIFAPLTWYTFALWERESAEDEILIQEVRLLGPSGDALIQGEAPVITPAQPEVRFHRAAHKFAGFPMRGLGDYDLVLRVKKGASGELVEVAKFPIPVSVRTPA